MGNDLASYMRFGRIKTCAWCCHLGQTHNHHAGFVICIGCGASYKCLCEVHPHSFHGECLELPLGGKFMKEWLGWWDALTLRNFSWGLKSFVSERTQNFLSTLTHMHESPCTVTCNRLCHFRTTLVTFSLIWDRLLAHCRRNMSWLHNNFASSKFTILGRVSSATLYFQTHFTLDFPTFSINDQSLDTILSR